MPLGAEAVAKKALGWLALDGASGYLSTLRFIIQNRLRRPRHALGY